MRGTVGRSLVLMAAAALLVGACGGPTGGADDGEGDDAGGVEAPSRAGRPQPVGTDAEAVQPYIIELLARYDTVANQIVADPAVAGDPDNPLVRDLLALFEPGSDAAAALVDSWAERGEAGDSMRPISDDRPATATRLDGDIETVSGDQVSFPSCDELHFEVVDGAGLVVERVRDLRQPGEGVAVRVDGEWRLRRLEVIEGRGGCRTEGP
jgi:hypothetical protein